MADSVQRSSVQPSLHEGGSIWWSLEKIIFFNPRAVLEASDELFGSLSASFGSLISEAQFKHLLVCAAHRAKVDLAQPHFDRHPTRAGPRCDATIKNFTDSELEQIGLEALRLLTTLMELLTQLIGERMTLGRFHIALRSVADTMASTERST